MDIIQSLKELAEGANDLARRLSDKGEPLTQRDKTLIRLAGFSLLDGILEEIKYAYLQRDRELVQEMIKRVDGLVLHYS